MAAEPRPPPQPPLPPRTLHVRASIATPTFRLDVDFTAPPGVTVLFGVWPQPLIDFANHATLLFLPK